MNTRPCYYFSLYPCFVLLEFLAYIVSSRNYQHVNEESDKGTAVVVVVPTPPSSIRSHTGTPALTKGTERKSN